MTGYRYPLLLILRIVRKRRRARLALIAERHGLAVGRHVAKQAQDARETKERAA